MFELSSPNNNSSRCKHKRHRCKSNSCSYSNCNFEGLDKTRYKLIDQHILLHSNIEYWDSHNYCRSCQLDIDTRSKMSMWGRSLDCIDTTNMADYMFDMCDKSSHPNTYLRQRKHIYYWHKSCQYRNSNYSVGQCYILVHCQLYLHKLSRSNIYLSDNRIH